MTLKYKVKDLKEIAQHFAEQAVQRRNKAKTFKGEKKLQLNAEAFAWEQGADIIFHTELEQ